MTDRDKRIVELIEEYGPKAWAKISAILNEEGITPPECKAWTRHNLRGYCKTHRLVAGVAVATVLEVVDPPIETPGEAIEVEHVVIAGSPTTLPAATLLDQEPEPMGDELTSLTKPPSSAEPTRLPEGIDLDALHILTELYRSGKLEAVISWYEESTGEEAVSEKRPTIKRGPKGLRNTGIAISDLIWKRADRKRKGKLEEDRVGQSMSQLIEFLLWQYLGSPPDLVQETPEP